MRRSRRKNRHIKACLIVLFFWGVLFSLKAQELSKLDSLHSSLSRSVSDSAKYSNYILLGNYFFKTQIYNDSAFYYTRKALELSQEESKARARVLFNLASIQTNAKNYKEAIAYYAQAKDISMELGLVSQVSGCYNNLGAVYFFKGDYDLAIDNYQKSFEIVEKSNNTRGMATSLMNIGEALYKKNDLLESKEVLEKSLALLNTVSSEEPSLAHRFYSQTLLALNKVPEAEENAQKALVYVKKQKDLQSIGQVYKLLSKIYQKKEQYKDALEYSKQYAIYNDSISNATALNEVEKLELNLALKDKQETIDRYTQREQYESIIYILLGVGIFLLGILIAGIFEIRRIKKELLNMQLSLLKTKE